MADPDHIPEVRRTKRLRLRPPTEADLDFMTSLFMRAEIIAHRPLPIPDTPEQSADQLVRTLDHWSRHGFGRWSVEADGELIGFGGIRFSTDFAGLNLSYHLHPNTWGKGYATELVEEALSLAFRERGFTRVIGLVRPANIASWRVLNKFGFSFEREVILHNAPTNLYGLAASSFMKTTR